MKDETNQLCGSIAGTDLLPPNALKVASTEYYYTETMRAQKDDWQAELRRVWNSGYDAALCGSNARTGQIISVRDLIDQAEQKLMAYKERFKKEG